MLSAIRRKLRLQDESRSERVRAKWAGEVPLSVLAKRVMATSHASAAELVARTPGSASSRFFGPTHPHYSAEVRAQLNRGRVFFSMGVSLPAPRASEAAAVAAEDARSRSVIANVAFTLKKGRLVPARHDLKLSLLPDTSD